jgi:hypothetical protein
MSMARGVRKRVYLPLRNDRLLSPVGRAETITAKAMNAEILVKYMAGKQAEDVGKLQGGLENGFSSTSHIYYYKVGDS